MSKKVDLDKLEQEIIGFGSVMTSGVDGDWLEVELEVTKFRVHRDGFVCENDGTEMTGIVLALARHVAPVAPDPGLREAIAELRRDITRFANHKMQYGMSFERGDTENAEANRLLAEQLSENIDAVLSVLAERGVR